MGIDFGKMRESYESTGHVYTYMGFFHQMPMNFDPDEQIRKSGVDRNIAAIRASDPNMEPVMDVFEEHEDLKQAFGRLCEVEGAGVRLLGEVMEGEGAPNGNDFARMMENPAMRQHLVDVLERTAEADNDEYTPEAMRDYLRAATRAARDPSQANRQAWMQQASNLGLETEAQRLQANAAMGGLDIGAFLRDPTGALMGMGLDPQIVAMLEPFLKFFTGAADYYLNGTPDQPGLIEIGGRMMDDAGVRANELRAQYGGTVTPEAGQYALDDRGRVVQAVAAPADLEDGDVDPERRGRQQFANLGGNRRALVTVDDERDIVYRGVTDTEFDSAGGDQVRSDLQLANIFAPRAEGRPQTEPETAAAQEFNTGMAAAARTWAPGQ